MHTRPYTAVLIESKTFTTRVMNISAPLRRADAKSEVEKEHPGCKLVALVPGHHAGGSYGFELDESLRSTTDRFVDPFDNESTL